MKERPILFSAPMVRAILAGNKTQTRRVVKHQPSSQGFDGPPVFNSAFGDYGYPGQRGVRCPYGMPGDRLWVREAWRAFSDGGLYEEPGTEVDYRATPASWAAASNAPWKPSIHMPRWASRITLEITGILVERLQEISEADAIAEGIERINGAPHWAWKDYSGNGQDLSPVFSYQSLWESINGPGSWEANPWVWVVEFKRI